MNSQQTLMQQIQDIAQDVFRTLGSGHSEAAYQNAMEIGLRLEGVPFEAQKVMELKYREHCIGFEQLDLVVGVGAERIIVDLKAIKERMGAPEMQQVRNYMNTLGIMQGLLVNFPQRGKSKNNQQPRPTVEVKSVLLEEEIAPEGPKQKTARAGVR